MSGIDIQVVGTILMIVGVLGFLISLALYVSSRNTDRPAPITAAIGLAERLGLRPIGKRAQRAWRRLRRGHIYEHSPMAWLSIVAPEEFRARYTGREIGHSFFALKYLHDVAAAPAKNDRVEDTRGA